MRTQNCWEAFIIFLAKTIWLRGIPMAHGPGNRVLLTWVSRSNFEACLAVDPVGACAEHVAASVNRMNPT